VNRRHRFAAILVLATATASLLAWQLTLPRDPILGRWDTGNPFLVLEGYHFHPDGTVTANGPNHRSGAWKFLPGPYYTFTPDAPVESIQTLYRESLHPPVSGYFTRAHFSRAETFQRALDQSTLHLIPESTRLRLYQGFADDGSLYFVLHDDGLTVCQNGFISDYQRPGTWLTRAWERLRPLFTP